MFKARTIVLLAAALMLGLFAVKIAQHWVQSIQTAPPPTAETTPVVVVAVPEIPYLQKVNANQVRTVSFPKDALPEGVFSDPAAVVGRIVTQTVYAGEPLVKKRLRDHEGGSPLALVVTPSKRAVAVRVNDVSGVGGFLLAGNRVDVLAASKEKDAVATRTVIQDVRILAVDQEAAEDKDKPLVVRSVTLEMTPLQAEALFKATEEGPIQLALRNPRDQHIWAKREPAPEVRATARAPVRPAPAVDDRRRITVINGAALSTYKCTRFDCSEQRSIP